MIAHNDGEAGLCDSRGIVKHERGSTTNAYISLLPNKLAPQHMCPGGDRVGVVTGEVQHHRVQVSRFRFETTITSWNRSSSNFSAARVSALKLDCGPAGRGFKVPP
jgi:hypothetical protein